MLKSLGFAKNLGKFYRLSLYSQKTNPIYRRQMRFCINLQPTDSLNTSNNTSEVMIDKLSKMTTVFNGLKIMETFIQDIDPNEAA
jgi:hypothetical protein